MTPKPLKALIQGGRERSDILYRGMLGPLLALRGIRRVVCFHTDHFEPFAETPDEEDKGWSPVRLVEDFVAHCAVYPHARQASLFFLFPSHPLLAQMPSSRLPTGTRLTGAEDDEIAFAWTPQTQENIERAVACLRDSGTHDIQLHVHHETWTSNTDPRFNDQAWRRWILERSTPEQDTRRFDAYVEHACAWMKGLLGSSFEDWAFIHGKWALNGSDRAVCQIHNEIAVLQRHGCRADFTFPAGRAHCDPTLEAPYTCRPSAHAKAYDQPDALACAVGIGTRTITPSRFLIWNSTVKHNNCSLDVYAPHIARNISRPWWTVWKWFQGGVVLDGTLFVKTHAHSMASPYWKGRDEPCFPLEHPLVVTLFDTLEAVCHRYGLGLAYWTTDDVLKHLDWLDKGKPRPADAGRPHTNNLPTPPRT